MPSALTHRGNTHRQRGTVIAPLVALSGMVALLGACRHSQTAAQTPVWERERPAWWYPYFIHTDVLQDYRISVHEVLTGADRRFELTEDAQFTVWISRRADGNPGCTVTLLPADAEAQARHDNLTQTWITSWAETNRDGVTVTPTGLLVRDAPLLQGPWRAGDRFTLAGFAYLFFIVEVKVVGFAHFTVAEVRGREVRLNFDFWAGEHGPAVRGEGTLAFAHDDLGITSVEAHWRRSDGIDTRQVDLVVTRLGVRPLDGGN